MSLFNVLGQKHVADLLRAGLKNNKVSHAYIFVGSKGVGKGKMALEFAKALNCTTDGFDACDTCQACRKIQHRNHQDVVWIKPEGNSIKIDQIRQLQKDSHFKKLNAKYKVFIIDQAETLTTQAANSLLKFLEEPSANSVILLLVRNINMLLPTIRSRCQTIFFPSLDINSIVKVLKEEGYLENDIILAAHLTEDIDQVKELINSEQFAQMRNLVIQWSEEIKYNNYNVLLSINDKILKNDYIKEHLPLFLDLLIMWYHDKLNIRIGRKSFIIYKEHVEELSKQAKDLTESQLVNKIEIIMQTKERLSSNMNPQLALEQMILTLWEG